MQLTMPGIIESQMAQKAMKSKQMKSTHSSILLERQGSAIEVAQCASFLASEESSYITAQILNVNGGLYF